MIVHYRGDENKHPKRAHGNNKNKTEIFRRTAPSVLNEIKTKVKQTEPAKVYRELVVKPVQGVDQGVLNPRNLKQVSNAKERIDKQNRLSQDDVYNLLEIKL